MKKAILLLASFAFATTAFAQTTPTTEIRERDNGTKKVVVKTGKTNVGQALENTTDAAGNIVKGANAVERGAKKAGRKIKKDTQKAGRKVKEGTSKMEEKSE